MNGLGMKLAWSIRLDVMVNLRAGVVATIPPVQLENTEPVAGFAVRV